METVLLGEAGGAGESDLLRGLLRGQWGGGGQGPAWVTARRESTSIHLRRVVWAVVHVGLRWDAHGGVGHLYRWGLVLLWVGVT